MRPAEACDGGNTALIGTLVTVTRGDMNISLAPDTLTACTENQITLTVDGDTIADITDNVVVTFTADASDIFTPTAAVFGGAFTGQTPHHQQSGEHGRFHVPARIRSHRPGDDHPASVPALRRRLASEHRSQLSRSLRYCPHRCWCRRRHDAAFGCCPQSRSHRFHDQQSASALALPGGKQRRCGCQYDCGHQHATVWFRLRFTCGGRQ